MFFVIAGYLRRVKWYAVTAVKNGFIWLALTLARPVCLMMNMKMTGFALIVVIHFQHD